MTTPADQKQIYLSADMAGRLAGIDIGSNSVRLLVAEVSRGGTYRILDEEREPTRLAQSISAAGKLRVNFHDFGRLFRDRLGVPNALYLDGKVSRLHAPPLH